MGSFFCGVVIGAAAMSIASNVVAILRLRKVLGLN